MLRGCACHDDIADRGCSPPIQLRNSFSGDAPPLEMDTDTERRDELRALFGERANRRTIEMVVMIVRYDHRIEWRECSQRSGRRMKSLRTGEWYGRDTLAPHGIRQHAHVIDFDEQRRMPEH